MMEDTSKDQILYAAKKEFAKKGFDGARMSSIAQRAKVNQALIHYYFQNKENLYDAVLHRLFGFERIKKFKNYIDKINLTPPEKLFCGIYMMVNYHLEIIDADLRKIVAREVADDRKQYKKFIRDHLIPRYESFENLIKEGVASGIFSTRNSLHVVIGIDAFITSYINNQTLFKGTSWYKQFYGDENKKELFEFLIDHTFKALRPSNKQLKIPEISSDIIKELDMLLETIKKENFADEHIVFKTSEGKGE